jgi:two-component system CheB/CheR fusion protein
MEEQQQVKRLHAPAQDGALFPVVGIGASASGLPALSRLLNNMPAAPGMALVVLLHQAPDDPGAAASLQGATPMPVVLASHRMHLLPDQVVLIPPGCSLGVEDGALIVGEPQAVPGIPLTINIFFRALAEAYGEQAIGVILSGMGSSCVAGLASIKEHGGVTIAQMPGETGESGVPQSAVDSGIVDFVLPAAQVPAKLLEMRDVMAMIRRHTTHGKRPAGLAPFDMKDFLAGATNFFRDREAFDVLEQAILPRILHDKEPGGPLRAWVTACSTGEEAYSLGMLLAEHAEHIAGAPAMQVFATDVDERAIAVARAGRYPDAIAADVPAARLARYFTLEDDQFKVRRLLRDRILFARHDLLRDPAFSHLDLITCRNVLMHLDREVARHVLEIFHSSLDPGGYLFLGAAESAELAPDLFVAVNTRHRLYQAKPARKAIRRLSMPPAAKATGWQAPERSAAAPAGRQAHAPSFAELHQRKLAQLAPPSLLLNAGAEILHASGDAAAFLRYSAGVPSTQVLSLVLPELRTALRSAILQAQKTGERACSIPLPCGEDGKAGVFRLSVLPMRDDGEGDGLMLVQFEAADAVPAGTVPGAGDAGDPTVRALEEALWDARKNLQQAVEQAEVSSAGMAQVIAGLQDTVDDLRAAIEELEVNREELASRNEELYTANVELEMRVEETSNANDDLSNLIASTDIATLFLDRAMRIQRYTPQLTRIFNIIAADVGRSFGHISHKLVAARLLDDVARVLMTLQPIEREVHSTDGRDYIVRVHPYRTGDDRVEGAVLTFFDISRRRIAEEALRESEARYRAFVTTSTDMLYTMSADWTVMRKLEGRNILGEAGDPVCGWLERYIPEEERARVMDAVARAIETRSTFELEHRAICPDGGIAWISSRAIPMLDAQGRIVEWFGAGTDITARKGPAPA